ncbi:hypothetical protein [Sphingobium chlorophenolicum]|nr:hypothetical protein [Sphingobium chlorophenolicum]
MVLNEAHRNAGLSSQTIFGLHTDRRIDHDFAALPFVANRSLNLREFSQGGEMERNVSVRASRAAWLVIAALILGFQAALVLLHEPWLDEWQSLQLAVQSPSLAELLANLRYEGHPPLYYLLLRATASIVPLPWVFATVQLPIALSTQGLILFRSFPNRLYRLCFALSAFVLIDYGTIARSLSLGVLLFLTAWAFRKYRWAWAALILLPAVDFLFGVLSLACLLIFWLDRNWSWTGFVLWMVSALFAAWTVIPAPDVVPALPPPSSPLVSVLVFLANLAQLLVPLPLSTKGLAWNTTFPVVIACITGFFAIVAAYFMKLAIPYHRIALGVFCGICLLFSLLVYMLPIRHLSLLALLLIALVWREQEMGIRHSPLFPTWLFVTTVCGLFLGGVNLVYPFDTGAQAAAWLRQSGLMHKHWVSVPDSRAQGIAMLNGMRFTRLGKVCQQDFTRWNNDLHPRSDTMNIEQLKNLAKYYGRFYILSDRRIIIPGEIRQLFYVPKGFNGQDYYFYEFGHHLAESGLRPSECRPGTLRLPPWSLQEQKVRSRIRQRFQALFGLDLTKDEVLLR